MRGIFHVHHAGREIPDVALEDDPAHELMEEGRHLEAVELAEERGMVEPDPSDGSLFHGLLEGGFGDGRPAIRRIVDLDEQIVRGQVRLVYRIGRADVVHREALAAGGVPQPLHSGVSERLMDGLTWLGERDDPVSRTRCRGHGPLIWRGCSGHDREECQCAETRLRNPATAHHRRSGDCRHSFETSTPENSAW